jgi:hypothetical protein
MLSSVQLGVLPLFATWCSGAAAMCSMGEERDIHCHVPTCICSVAFSAQTAPGGMLAAMSVTHVATPPGAARHAAKHGGGTNVVFSPFQKCPDSNPEFVSMLHTSRCCCLPAACVRMYHSHQLVPQEGCTLGSPGGCRGSRDVANNTPIAQTAATHCMLHDRCVAAKRGTDGHRAVK